MKTKQKLAILLTICSLSLVACQSEKRCFCLETYDYFEYQEGYCMQISRADVIDTVYVMCLPTYNPETGLDDYYEITWNEQININRFTFVGGLEGKEILGMALLADNTLRINVSRPCKDQNATSGYLRISEEAFVSHSEASHHATLYAYFSIGKDSQNVVKPSDISFV